MESDGLAKEILALEKQLLMPKVRHSSKTLRLLLADSFIEYGSSGRVYDKAQIIQLLLQENSSPVSIDNFRIILLAPNVVLATYRSAHDILEAKAPPVALRSSIWQHHHGRWQMIFHQGTLTTV